MSKKNNFKSFEKNFEKFYSEYVQMNKGKFDLFDLTNGALKYAMEKCKSK